MMRNWGLCFLCLVLAAPAFTQRRSFDELFPGLESRQRERVFSPSGLMVTSEKNPAVTLLPPDALDMDIPAPVLGRNPSFLVESLLVIPHPEKGEPAELIDLYNALGRVRDLKGRLYHSATRNEDVPLFEDATRIAGEKKTSAIPDPPPADSVPPRETIYLRLKDLNFGNSYYRADITAAERGLLYSLSNFRNLSYLFITVIRQDKFIARLYMEPVAEGILIYGIAGAEVSDFIASKIHIPSAVRKRLELIIGWVRAGVESPP